MKKDEESLPLLLARGVRKSFEGREVLRGIDLEIGLGESIALIGSNGCGKSTFLKCCNRLVEPDEGSIIIGGRDLRLLDPKELRQARTRLGFIFQKHNLVRRLSSLSNVIHGNLGKNSGVRYWLQSLAPQASREKAMECLEAVGLAHLASRQVSFLSGGESQRVAIARSLMQDPVLLFADEPVASLDPKVGHEVMAHFRGLVKNKGISLLFVSHDLDHALEYADRIVAIQAGKVVLNRRAVKVKKNELKEIYE
jgi:phosphonate transport system ATP-binding protein